MHLIQKPIDRVFSDESPQWHGLATVENPITEATIKSFDSPILEQAMTIPVKRGKNTVHIPTGYKAIFADLSAREDLTPEQSIAPLFMPRESYQVITNGEVIQAVKNAMAGIDHKITTIGTLSAFRRFFVSVALQGNREITVNGDKIRAVINFITSHDGTLAFEVYDSLTRIVCNNTLVWSREAARAMGFKVYHTKNAGLRIDGMADIVNRLLSGRLEFAESMAYLASVPVTQEHAEQMVAGYFAQLQGKEKFATRTLNQIDEIISLAWHGMGNEKKRKTTDSSERDMWNLFNGATEFWTHGGGVGKSETRDKGRKAYTANFGKAMDHKEAFCAYLLDTANLAENTAKGAEILAASRKD
jgi:hypothetical protein